MRLDYKKYIQCLFICGLFLVIFACNGVGSSTNPSTNPPPKPSNPSSLKTITAFSLPSFNGLVNGTITGQNIEVMMPFGTDLTSLIANFTTTGQNIMVDDKVQVSGTTANDFANPVLYKVIAADGSISIYKVRVKVAQSSLKTITSYSLGGIAGIITGQNIAVTMPFGTDLTSLIANFTTAGQSIMVNDKVQVSGTTANDFANPVLYKVIAADGNTSIYQVTVKVALPFVAYYPSGCILGVSCTCVQDTTTHDVWTVSTSEGFQCYNSLINANGTCSGQFMPGKKGYITTLNANKTCGFTDNGWNLPTSQQLYTMSKYVSSQEIVNKGAWFNANGFRGIENDGIYLGLCNDKNCTLPSGSNGVTLSISMRYGAVLGIYQGDNGSNTYGWGVHSGQ